MARDVVPVIPAAIAQLLVEHDVARQQLATLEATLAATRVGNGAAMATGLTLAEQTLDYLQGDLERHIAREEGPLFPPLKAALPADDRLIDEMLAELTSSASSGTACAASSRNSLVTTTMSAPTSRR